MTQTLTNEIIDAAIEGFEAQKRRIDNQIAELRSMRNGTKSRTTSAAAAPKRKLSPDAIRRIQEGQRRRWAKARAQEPSSGSEAVKAPKKKRRLTAAGRKAIQDALRRRWAKERAEGESAKAPKNTAGQKKARTSGILKKRTSKAGAGTKRASTKAASSASVGE